MLRPRRPDPHTSATSPRARAQPVARPQVLPPVTDPPARRPVPPRDIRDRSPLHHTLRCDPRPLHLRGPPPGRTFDDLQPRNPSAPWTVQMDVHSIVSLQPNTCHTQIRREWPAQIRSGGRETASRILAIASVSSTQCSVAERPPIQKQIIWTTARSNTPMAIIHSNAARRQGEFELGQYCRQNETEHFGSQSRDAG
jgi:hypothetical protein